MAFSLQKFPLFRGQTNLACDHLGGMKSPTYLRIELPLPKSPFIPRSAASLSEMLSKKPRTFPGAAHEKEAHFPEGGVLSPNFLSA